MRRLLAANAALAALLVVHIADHTVRQPADAQLGLATALGFVAIHLAPHWSMFSDPYPDRYLDAGSWIQMSANLAAGLWLAYEGWRVTATRRPEGWSAASGAPRSSAR